MLGKFLIILAQCAFLFAEARKYNEFAELLKNTFQTGVKSFGEQLIKGKSISPVPTPVYPDYDYWKFLPQISAKVIPGGSSVSWTSPCFESNQATATYSADMSAVNIQIVSSKALSAQCEDIYMTFANAAIKVSTSINTDKKNTVTTAITLELPSDLTSAEKWDLDTKGVRLLRYFVGSAEAYQSLLNTAELFIGDFLPSVPEPLAKKNIDFLEKYTKFQYPPRDQSLNVIPDESEIKSGDAFYIVRLDGLDPMLAWAMGSTTGHVTTALWIDGELYVTESTIADAYWPTDYIQKTPYRTWIQQCIDASMNVVYAPLNEEARKSYNVSAAVDFFKANEGYEYGFQTMLWAWIDTASGNFPCLPPDFSTNCLQWDLLEPFIAYVDRKVPQAGDTMWNGAMAKRLDLPTGMRTSDYLQQAGLRGMTSTDLVTIPEQDTWLYNTTRYDEPAVGRCMVCCVYVCSSWKAAGVFGDLADSINCAEQTNWDDYALTIHADNYRQIIGNYTLTLNNFKSRTAYAHMAEKCAALPPDYTRAEGC